MPTAPPRKLSTQGPAALTRARAGNLVALAVRAFQPQAPQIAFAPGGDAAGAGQ
jgi:hypothetical protein